MENELEIHRTHVDGSVEVRVIAVVNADAIRVVVGVGVGHLDGGSHQTWPVNDVPADLRRPNAIFWVTLRSTSR